MIYLDLFLGFLKVGCFSFGGAYAAIPLIRDVVLSYGWLDDEALSYMIAISESTPGPIMVNLATYVGSSQGGLLGSALATFAVILPAYLIILLVLVILKTLLKNPTFQAVLGALKPCVVGIILATGANMILNYFLVREGSSMGLLLKPLIITLLLAAVWLFYGKGLIIFSQSPLAVPLLALQFKHTFFRFWVQKLCRKSFIVSEFQAFKIEVSFKFPSKKCLLYPIQQQPYIFPS